MQTSNSKPAAKINRPTAQTIVPNANAAEDPQVHQVPTPVLSKISRETTSDQAATSQSLPFSDDGKDAPGNEPGESLIQQAFRNVLCYSSTADDQSLPPSDAGTSGNGNAPTRKLGGQASIRAFFNRFPSSSTADDRNVTGVPQPSTLVVDPYYSQPGAVRVDGINDMAQTRTNHTPTPAPVTSTQSRLEEGITQSEQREYMVEATLVSQTDMLVGVIIDPVEEEFWRQRKVQRYAFLLFLATAGLAIGVGVAVALSGGDVGSATLVVFASASPSASGSAGPSTSPSVVPSSSPSGVCYYSCEAAMRSGMVESGEFDMCPTGDPKERFTAFCDQETNGGGWMLFFAYNHIGGENDELDQSVLPTDPDAGYSHMDLEDTGYILADIEAVRYYCHTSAHNRRMHFTTTNSKVKEIARTGSQVGNTAASWTADFTTLDGHNALLPEATDSFFAFSDGGLHNFPFWLSGTSHWGVRGEGDRWECDDTPHDASQDTLHNMWVRMARF
jgi:hypothetical protein